MGFKDIVGNSRTKKICKQDPNSGQLHCKLSKTNRDGTEQLMAQGIWGLGNDGKVKLLDMEERESGAFKELEKDVLPRITSSGRNIPEDY